MAKAAVTRSIRDDHQKNFLKIFEGLTGKHNRWEIWRDFIHLTAIEISNSTDRLNALGYEMADDEKALQDGTHQLFAVYGSGSKADTPCDKCKAAHPECDKCCKTCDDHCNAFQLCRKEYGE